MKKPQHDSSALFDRDPKHFETDKAAVAAIIQAAVNVELFTIPLYMTSLYSLQGLHQITGAKSNIYQGRLWPGLAPSFRPGQPKGNFGNIPENEKAFNTVFSVFIEEMLHLQIASNLANILDVKPEFTQMSTKADNYAWSCYGDNKTEIPYILDFRDCKPPFDQIKVKLDKLCLDQNELFLAIEAPEGEEPGKTSAIERIKDDPAQRLHAYFPSVPLKGWEKGDALPMFGSIGHMYQCLWDYFDIEYKEKDGKTFTLWERMYMPGSLQRDLFNVSSPGHPYREYQGLNTTVDGWLPPQAKELAFKLICAITDQGEGKGISKNLRPSAGLKAVTPINQASEEALKKDYPSYNDTGEQIPSAKAYARFGNGAQDHYERFLEIKGDLESNKIVTWDQWRVDRVKSGKGKWEASDLMTTGYDENTYNLPPAEKVADALNRIALPKKADGSMDVEKQKANYKQFCQIATGAIAGITTVLNDYWAKSAVGFPFPSMGGSGDRLMMCWAVFGQLPDLSVGVAKRDDTKLYHACQGLDLNKPASADMECGSPEVYHNCRGSNSCKAEGGCGFVQEVGKSQTCSSSSKAVQTTVLCGTQSAAYSAPGDNMCKSFGGCAVPISASQIFPDFTNTDGKKNVGYMELNDFVGKDHKTQKINDKTIKFLSGDFVHDVAWRAYSQVLINRGEKVPDMPEPSDIRLAFPPST